MSHEILNANCLKQFEAGGYTAISVLYNDQIPLKGTKGMCLDAGTQC